MTPNKIKPGGAKDGDRAKPKAGKAVRKPTRAQPRPKPAHGAWAAVPVWRYPAAPHALGLDWLEIAVPDPVAAAALYESIGFHVRGRLSRGPAVSIGGLTLVFRPRGVRASAAASAGADPDAPTPVHAAPPVLLLQVAVDDIVALRNRLLDLSLEPGSLRRQSRGDVAFIWTDPGGLSLRFVGPHRAPATLKR